MAYKIKATLMDKKYYYQGYLHEDQVLRVSVWNEDVQFPIGEVADVLYDAGEAGLAEKYGADFARAFALVFSEDCFPAEIEPDQWEYGRLALCDPLELVFYAEQMASWGVVVSDHRSQKSKRISSDILELRDVVDEQELRAALSKREWLGRKKLTYEQKVSWLSRKYHVCKGAVRWYLDTEISL